MLIRHYFRGVTLSIFLLIISLIFFGCGDSSRPQPSGQGSRQPSQPLKPDLIISSIQLHTAHHQPRHFSFNIYVRNVGSANSGPYDLAFHIRDVGRGQNYPGGTFRQGGLGPGENVCAHSEQNRMVNFPGNYQIIAEIRPFNFQDGNPNNNRSVRNFSVQ